MSRVNIQLPEKTLFSHTLEVRTYDINKGGHLGHDRLISLLHEAREHFFFALGFKELDVAGVGIVVADLMIQYLGEAFMSQSLRVDISLSDKTRKSVDMYYHVECVETGQAIAKAKTAIVFFDYQSRSAVAVPSAFTVEVNNRMGLPL